MTRLGDVVFRRGYTAAVSPLGNSKPGGASGANVLRDWQERSFGYYNTIGEVWYASQFYARIAGVDWPVEKRDPETGDWIPADDPGGADAAARAVWERVRDPQGDRRQMIGNYARLRFLAGESVLVVHFDDPTLERGDPDMGFIPPEGGGQVVETWEILSTTEWKSTADGNYERAATTGGSRTSRKQYRRLQPDEPPADGTALAWRLWRRHPERSEEPDAPMRAILDLCEELLLLRRSVRARARSRLPAGVGLMPRQAFLNHELPRLGKDPMSVTSPVTRALLTAQETAIKDEGSAAAYMPTMLFVDEKYIDKFRLWDLSSHRDSYPERQIREEIIQAMARGLDMPPEALTGAGNVNHWTGWLIDEQKWAHLEPVADDVAADFTTAFLRPQLRAETTVDAEQYRIGVDPARILVKPDRGKDTVQAHADGVINDAAYRRELGFAEDDAPAGTDPQANSNPALRGADSGNPDDTAEPGPPNDGEPTDEEAAAASRNGGVMAPDAGLLTIGWMNGAVDMAETRCRELAGSRVRNMLRKHSGELDGEHKDTPAVDLAAALGRDQVIAVMGKPAPERLLVRGGTATLHAALIRNGLSHTNAEAICLAVETNAARDLYEPRLAVAV